MGKYRDILIKCIHVISVILFAWIIFLVIFCADVMEYACKIKFIVSNIVICIFLIGAVFLYRGIVKRRQIAFPDLNYGKIVKVCTVIFFAVQVYVCFNIFFITGWDSGGYVLPSAQALAESGNIEAAKGFLDIYPYDFKTIKGFLDMYPNNLLIINIYSVILKLNGKMGILTGDYQWMSIVICNCAISSFSCRLIYVIASKKLEEKYAFAGYVIALALIGMSPWMVICYSDSLALFLPIFMVYVYMNEKIPYILKYSVIFVGGYLGYCIKPQVLIVIIAIIISECLKRIGQTGRKMWKRDAVVVCISGAAVILAATCLNSLYKREGFDPDSDQKIGMTHYFMMGMNPDRLGMWSGEDVNLSASCKNQEERSKKNIEVSKERLKNYGVIGYFKLLSKKMLTNYNDGTFAWGVEGNFYAIIPDDINTGVSGRLKQIYYNDAPYSWLFYLVEQCIWIGVILFIGVRTVFAAAAGSRERDYEYLAIILSLIGLTLFELLFEARARYLYIYSPVYVIAAVYGIRDLDYRLRKKDKNMY